MYVHTYVCIGITRIVMYERVTSSTLLLYHIISFWFSNTEILYPTVITRIQLTDN